MIEVLKVTLSRFDICVVSYIHTIYMKYKPL